MMRLAPGGPFDQERPLPPEIEQQRRARPTISTSRCCSNICAISAACCAAISGRPTGPRTSPSRELLADGRSGELKVGGLAVLLADPAGHASPASLAALRQNSWADYAVMALAMVGITIPNFVMAPLLTLIFGVYLRLAAGRRLGRRRAADPGPAGDRAGAAADGAHRAADARRMIEVLHANYVRTARAKGLRERAGRAAPRAAGRPAAGGVLSRPDDRGRW